MANEIWDSASYGPPQGLQEGVELKYAVPFPWGALHMTAQADQEYGFVPLTPHVLKGEAAAQVGEAPLAAEKRTDVYFMNPTEFTEQLDTTIEWPEGDELATLAARSRAHSSGYEIYVAAAKNAEHERELLEEVSEMELRQHLVHQFCDAATHSMRGVLVQESSDRIRQRIYTKIKRLGTAGIAGGGLITLGGIGAEIVTDKGGLGVLLAGLTYTTINFLAAAKTALHYLKDEPEIRQILHKSAEERALMVTNDIHDVYCSHGFNQRERLWLGPE